MLVFEESVHGFPVCVLHASFYGCRQRRAIENKLSVCEERLEDAESQLRQTKQLTSDSETRYDEVSCE